VGLDRSWAGLFRKEILPHLPIEAITAAFHARLGRPRNGAPTCEKDAFPVANGELAGLHAAFESILVEWTNRYIRFNTRSLHEDDFVLQQAA
jgi:hypothetical protein